MNLEETKVRRKESKNDKRFYTSRDIAIIKNGKINILMY